jgi:hypothetical protein
MAAYKSRIASKDYDLRAGFAAWTLFALVHAAFLTVFGFLPVGLLQLSEGYFELGEWFETATKLLTFGGLAYYVLRIMIPVGFDIVWRMDILSNKMGYVRPNDVYRLFDLWMNPGGRDLRLLRRLSRDA